MADRYFIDTALSLGVVELDGPEAHHLATVCRVRPGDAVCLFNGDGHEYPARVVEVAKRRVTLEVTAIESPLREVGFRLEVAAPLPKGDRAQFLLEKLTELGVTSFTPLQTAAASCTRARRNSTNFNGTSSRRANSAGAMCCCRCSR